MLKIKLFVVAIFSAFTACVFFVSNDGIHAQTKESVKKKSEILEKVADYKNWRQINKTDEKSGPDISTVPDSSAMG